MIAFENSIEFFDISKIEKNKQIMNLKDLYYNKVKPINFI